ncbi:hypothetical protein B0T18DRAFT_225894 [Schizothecium vesticola]|uniref:Uncharacterized protein n=1 Tax=Schizothecium vesticola TaxID=314040 RepID=A0AA40EKS0_9PEZI|nr:hypothetical protein B0T18DRAFT_225894 [Schizothecium vesticola]
MVRGDGGSAEVENFGAFFPLQIFGSGHRIGQVALLSVGALESRYVSVASCRCTISGTTQPTQGLPPNISSLSASSLGCLVRCFGFLSFGFVPRVEARTSERFRCDGLGLRFRPCDVPSPSNFRFPSLLPGNPIFRGTQRSVFTLPRPFPSIPLLAPNHNPHVVFAPSSTPISVTHNRPHWRVDGVTARRPSNQTFYRSGCRSWGCPGPSGLDDKHVSKLAPMLVVADASGSRHKAQVDGSQVAMPFPQRPSSPRCSAEVWYRGVVVVGTPWVHRPFPQKKRRHRHGRSGDGNLPMISNQRKERKAGEVGGSAQNRGNLRDICPSGEGLNISGVGSPPPLPFLGPLPSPTNRSAAGLGSRCKRPQQPDMNRQEGRS